MAPRWFIRLSLWIHQITPIHFMLSATAYSGALYLLGQWHAALVFLSTMVMVLGIVGVLKLTLKVPRPAACLVDMKNSNRAFPSGHSAAAAFVGTMVPYTFPFLPSEVAMYAFGAALMVLVIVVALSRLSLCVHTLSQVTVGLVLGVGIPIMAVMLIDPPLTNLILSVL